MIRRSDPKTLTAITALLILLVVGGCDKSRDQVDFERNAYQIPDSFTETDAGGRVLRQDDRQWNIAPMFQGLVEIWNPAYPNPTSGGQTVTIELEIRGIDMVHGLYPFTLNMDKLERYPLYNAGDPDGITYYRNTLESGIIFLDIDPYILASIYGSYTAAQSENEGIHRIFLYDRHGNMITYGDIKLE
ncbi:hypothetical protein QLX67_01580 [Balneolaceae bacterium ANBcel3]|nr:hypothetical protein [Balneolaceae bacterium ANBcel3]